ncbi:MAG: polysaccharide biosynthesis tyrosine autokinase, partial [Actinobacteria bacterium]|nr:polysaccharide biosynthesis tyrosine autokinase [Actinomycetota bacterium]
MAAAAPPPEEHFQLREYIGILRFRKWSVLAVSAVVLALGLFLSFRQTPLYASSARVLVKPINTSPQLQINPLIQQLNMETEREIARSEGVAEIAGEDLPPSADDTVGGQLSIDNPPNTAILVFSYTDASPVVAQQGANAFANAYLQYKREQANESLQNIRNPLQEQLTELEQELRNLERHLGPLPSPAQQTRRDEITGQIAVIRSQLAPLLAIVVDPGDVILSAALSASPSSPNLPVNAALSLFVGLALGMVTALLRERLDDGLRGRTDLETQSGAPVLAVIPKVVGWKKREETRLTAVAEPKSAASEAYRTLRTSMLFAAAQRGLKTILVASATAGEGKSTTAANLSVVLANADKRVILVNADLRKPRVHRFFGVQNKTGVVDVLWGEAKPWEALVDPGIENLRLFPSGPIPARPAELLGSEAMGELLAELREVADFIIIDSAPVLVVSDALALAPLCDGVLYVADAESTSRGAVAHAREQLEQVGVQMVGSVLNHFDASKARSAPYYYRYYYRYKHKSGYSYDAPYGVTADTAREE